MQKVTGVDHMLSSRFWAALGAAEQASGMTEVGLDGESPDQAA